MKTSIEQKSKALSFQISEVCKKHRKDYMHIKTIDQCLRSSSSVAANIQEALASQSNKMILSKLYISLRERKKHTSGLKNSNMTESFPILNSTV
jgi:four helix bundle protein